LPRDGDMGFWAAPLAWVAHQFPVLLGGRIAMCAEGSALTLTRWQVGARQAVGPQLAQGFALSTITRMESYDE